MILWLMALSTSSAVWAADITLVSDSNISFEGYFVLSWTSQPDSQTPVLLQQAASENFSNPVEFTLPANGSVTLTGFDNGRYFFRARQDGSPFSDTVIVEVAHHSLQRALSFFMVGLALFLILVVTIFRGNRILIDEQAGKSKETDNAG